jgi:hypothetical protein
MSMRPSSPGVGPVGSTETVKHRDQRGMRTKAYHRSMTDQQQRLADLLIHAQGALIELEGRLPGENEDVAGARRSWERATRAVSDALALVEPED